MPNLQPRLRIARLSLIAALLATLLLGACAYSVQFRYGLGVSALSRRVPWGLYISQFAFLVGIAASSVVILVPQTIHRRPSSEPLVTLGETVSVIALLGAISFVLVDLGRPARLVGMLLHPCPSSLMFWDIVALGGYLVLCSSILVSSLLTKGRPSPSWFRGLVLLSIPWACAIHIVTALLFCGLSARPGWMTAILAPKFLATAFASGAALLYLLSQMLGRARPASGDGEAARGLLVVMAYAVLAVLLLSFLEVFTAYYAGLPEPSMHLKHLYGLGSLVPGSAPTPPSALQGSTARWMMVASLLLAFSLFLLLVSRWRGHGRLMTLACAAVLSSVFIEKGLWFVPSGFEPSSLGYLSGYRPSIIEILVATGIYSGGALAFLAACGMYLARPLSSSAQAPELGSSPNLLPIERTVASTSFRS